jgi:hypothetical protein
MSSDSQQKVVRILGVRFRFAWNHAHHLYWGILDALIAYTGIVSAIALGGPIGAILLVIQVLHLMIGLYVTMDDIYQHRKQVFDMNYTSPVHKWYGKALYGKDSWMGRLVTRLNLMMDGS